MTISISVKEAVDRGILVECMDAGGYNPWARAEGLLNDDDTIQLTEEQAISAGLIKKGDY